MEKEIRLPSDKSNPNLVEKVTQSILGVDVFNQSTIEKSISFYKLALYSKGLAEFIKDKEHKIIDFKYGESYVPAVYEVLETKRDTTERLIISGYILVPGEHPVVLHYYPSMCCQVLKVYCKTSDVSYVENFLKDLDTYVSVNNYYKNEKITPLGKFLPISTLTKDDVILDPEIYKRIDDTVFNFFNHKDKFKTANIPFKRGVIFSGLPGTGKTLSGKIIMNYLKDITFIWVTARDFDNLPTSYLFDMARELQPAVLFIEDVDACLRGSTLDNIKTQMDGLESNEGILTILSTNFPNQLPKTLIDRPGRFDDVIEFELPNENIRYQILSYYSKTLNIENKENCLHEISQLSAGLTPSHLKEVIVSSFMSKNSEEVITIEDLKKALERLKGLHNKFKEMNTDEKFFKYIINKKL
jgi:hypothetical protein